MPPATADQLPYYISVYFHPAGHLIELIIAALDMS